MRRRMAMDEQWRAHSVCGNWFVNHGTVISQVSLSAVASLGWRWQITFSTQAIFGCWFVGIYCRLISSSWMIFTTSAFICPGQVTSLANDTWCLAFLFWLIYHEPKGVVSREYHGWQQQFWPNKPHLAQILFFSRVAWIINLYINFPADRKLHVDMSSVSHGDWSWVRWDGRGRKPHGLADSAIPVNSHILFSLPGSERVSFPTLAQEGVWHRNRIRSEVTCYLAGTVYQQTFWQLELLTGLLWWTDVTAGLLFQLTVSAIIVSIENASLSLHFKSSDARCLSLMRFNFPSMIYLLYPFILVFPLCWKPVCRSLPTAGTVYHCLLLWSWWSLLAADGAHHCTSFLAQTSPLCWVKACGTWGQPTAGHRAPSNGLVAAGTGHRVVSWDTIAEG